MAAFISSSIILSTAASCSFASAAAFSFLAICLTSLDRSVAYLLIIVDFLYDGFEHVYYLLYDGRCMKCSGFSEVLSDFLKCFYDKFEFSLVHLVSYCSW